MFWKSKDDEVVLPKTCYERERYMQNKIKELEETIEKLTNETENEEVVFYTDDYEVIKLRNENIELKEKQKELEQEIRWRIYTNKTLSENYDNLLERASELADKIEDYEELYKQDFDSTYPTPITLEYLTDLKLENIELKTTLEQRDLEIKALKHMLDRKDEEQ